MNLSALTKALFFCCLAVPIKARAEDPCSALPSISEIRARAICDDTINLVECAGVGAAFGGAGVSFAASALTGESPVQKAAARMAQLRSEATKALFERNKVLHEIQKVASQNGIDPTTDVDLIAKNVDSTTNKKIQDLVNAYNKWDQAHSRAIKAANFFEVTRFIPSEVSRPAFQKLLPALNELERAEYEWRDVDRIKPGQGVDNSDTINRHTLARGKLLAAQDNVRTIIRGMPTTRVRLSKGVGALGAAGSALGAAIALDPELPTKAAARISCGQATHSEEYDLMSDPQVDKYAYLDPSSCTVKFKPGEAWNLMTMDPQERKELFRKSPKLCIVIKKFNDGLKTNLEQTQPKIESVSCGPQQNVAKVTIDGQTFTQTFSRDSKGNGWTMTSSFFTDDALGSLKNPPDRFNKQKEFNVKIGENFDMQKVLTKAVNWAMITNDMDRSPASLMEYYKVNNRNGDLDSLTNDDAKEFSANRSTIAAKMRIAAGRQIAAAKYVFSDVMTVCAMASESPTAGDSGTSTAPPTQ